MKEFLLLFFILILGCESKYENVTDNYKLPSEMSKCVIYNLHNDNGGSITVIRCPNSSTSLYSREGKTDKKTIVVDGIRYMEEK